MSKPPVATKRQADETELGDPLAHDLPICGIVRPIATMGEAYPDTHWLEVHELVAEAALKAGFRLRLVSESDQVGIIVSEIIRNLHENPLVIVDVSGRNPNVMFELGMRVTFQKPVIIITDDHTPFSFDIQGIRHIQYRRDLRTSPTRKFQTELTAAITGTMEAVSRSNYKGYLQQFGKIEITQLEDQNVSLNDLAQAVQDLRGEVRTMSRSAQATPTYRDKSPNPKNFSGIEVLVTATELSEWEKLLRKTPYLYNLRATTDSKWMALSLPGIDVSEKQRILEEAASLNLQFVNNERGR